MNRYEAKGRLEEARSNALDLVDKLASLSDDVDVEWPKLGEPGSDAVDEAITCATVILENLARLRYDEERKRGGT